MQWYIMHNFKFSFFFFILFSSIKKQPYWLY
uniref:Uncharacterized protein n=1 Tax=Siphoviridae sp. ctGQT3 TaxID=2825412 RepID=A0A8S5UEA9_9CAUD|nr:MAG TPA: hypothetical protein [Siphoviridae sp. ctGQT3]